MDMCLKAQQADLILRFVQLVRKKESKATAQSQMVRLLPKHSVRLQNIVPC